VSPDASKTFEAWELEISNAFSQNGAKEWKNVLSMVLPKRLSDVVVSLSGVDAGKKCATVSREERKSVCRLLS
jgi:predicted flavoprotein YhiN